ncbi:MAG: hypothetical protein ACRDF0_08345 [Candidatus Limnocylindria bacterium]
MIDVQDHTITRTAAAVRTREGVATQHEEAKTSSDRSAWTRDALRLLDGLVSAGHLPALPFGALGDDPARASASCLGHVRRVEPMFAAKEDRRCEEANGQLGPISDEVVQLEPEGRPANGLGVALIEDANAGDLCPRNDWSPEEL